LDPNHVSGHGLTPGAYLRVLSWTGGNCPPQEWCSQGNSSAR
jgi:hypothetical protein